MKMDDDFKDFAPKINSIKEQKKLSKKTKNDNKYTKISTDENTFESIELSVEKELPVTTINKTDDFIQANPIMIEKSQSFCYKRIGNTFAFLGDREGNPLFMVGPHWLMYFCFSSLVSVGVFLFNYAFWVYLHIVFKVAGIVIYSIFIISYTYTFLINPGYPKHDLGSRTGEPRGKYRFCQRCKMWVNVDKKTNHCFDCDICIEGYDHHCPWTSKCIGVGNLNSFYVFVISTFFIFAFLVCALTNAQKNRGKKY